MKNLKSLLKISLRKKFITKEEYNELSKIKVMYDDRYPSSAMAMIVKPLRYSIIKINKSRIKEYYKRGCTFNGIVPKSYRHAIRLVLEHETAHMVSNFLGESGHGSLFQQIAYDCYDHTDWRIRYESS